MQAAGTIRDGTTGSVINVDYLGPLRRHSVKCGPMNISTIDADTITANNLIVTGPMAQADPPRVSGPNTHVWIPFGPVQINTPGTYVLYVPVGLGSWQLELMAAGTGRDSGVIYAENFAHYNILASLRSSGTAVTLIQTNVGHTSETGNLITPIPPAPFTVITFEDGGTELIIRISPLVDSNWSGYVRLVGAPAAV